MSERCQCGCMDRRDRFGNYDLCPLAEAWLEQQVVVDGVMSEHERALANARTAWSIESWRPSYFAWKELALELATYVLASEKQAA